MVNGLWNRTVSAALAGLREREINSRDLVDALAERIAATEPVFHAYACLDLERARADAARADDERARGRVLGDLHGLPVAIKDLIWTAEDPTTAGSPVLADWIAPEDATVVRRLREAGALVVGKTVTHEFGASQNVPATRNAWDSRCFPGGSSAGSAVAVAVRSAFTALGTDSGGSTRKPASLNGVVGLKATYGRVSRHGVIYAGSSMDQVGPITRTVEDCALVSQVLSGYDPKDPSSIDEPVPDYLAGLREGVAGQRLGVPDYYFGPELGQDVRTAVTAALDVLRSLGAELVDIDLPAHGPAAAAGYATLMVEQAAYHQQWLRRPREREYEPETRWLLATGALLPAVHYQAAQRLRLLMRAELKERFERHRLDALVTPTLPAATQRVDRTDNVSHVPGIVRYTVPSNLTGLPALSVPCGFTPAGLPVGLQVIGKPFDEAAVLRVAWAYESVGGWVDQQPRVFAAPAAAG